MNHKHTSSALVVPASSLVPPEQLAQQAADAVRELLAEAAGEHHAQLRGRAALLGRLAPSALWYRADPTDE